MTSAENPGLHRDVRGAVDTLPGTVVEIEQGTFKGVRATVIDTRANGRVLVRIQPAVYLELAAELVQAGRKRR